MATAHVVTTSLSALLKDAEVLQNVRPLPLYYPREPPRPRNE